MDPAPEGDTHVFTGARIIAGDGLVFQEAAMVVDGGMITAVGPLAAMTLPAGLPHTDLGGRTIIPALIDSHVHLGFEGYGSWGGENYSLDNVLDHLDRMAYYGFGTVLSTGTDPDDVIQRLADLRDRGELTGADPHFAVGIAPSGQGPNASMLEAVGEGVVRGVDSPEQAAEVIAEVRNLPVDFVKIWVDDRNGGQRKMSPEVYRAVVRAAEEAGLGVLAHQQTAEDMRGLTGAGISGFLHGRLGPEIDASLIEAMADGNVFVIPNLGITERGTNRDFEDPFFADAVPSSVTGRLADGFRSRDIPAETESRLAASFRSLIDGGVPIILGTDAGAIPDHFFGYTGHRELQRYVELGMMPEQALASATSRAADRLGLERRGRIGPGMRADFVVLSANPLDDIRNTRQIVDVYLRGQRIDREALRSRFTAE